MLRPMDMCRRMGSIPSRLAKGSHSETHREKRHCGLAGARAPWFSKLSTLCFPRWPYCTTLPYTTPLERVSPLGGAAADAILMASYTLFCPVSSGVFCPGPLQARLFLNLAGSAPTRQCCFHQPFMETGRKAFCTNSSGPSCSVQGRTVVKGWAGFGPERQQAGMAVASSVCAQSAASPRPVRGSVCGQSAAGVFHAKPHTDVHILYYL